MKPVLILQQLPCEPAALIEDTIREAGVEVEVEPAPEGKFPQTLERHSGVVVMGGPMSADDDHDFIERQSALLRWCVERDAPVLGVCLGAQLLAKAAGARIMRSPERELGWYPLRPTRAAPADPLFAALRDELHVFQWHGESFTLPEDAVLLASCPRVENQAFRIGASQYGLQFHTEVDERMIREWIEAGADEREALGREGIEALLRSTPRYLPAARAFCRRMVAAWIRML